jgi:secondary thiamine-phosphate synthase enzyme
MSATLHHQELVELDTPGRGLVELTERVQAAVAASGVRTGLVVVHCAHTSCSLLIHENADPSATRDLLAWLERLAPDGDPRYAHDAEGPDDMPAHLRSVLTRSNETIPVVAGRAALGTWQGLFLAEHRTRPHRRRVHVHVTGLG